MNTHRHRAIAIVAVALFLGVACAARGPRNTTRVAALGLVDAAVELSQTETTLFGANLYPKATHDQLVDGKLKVLYAARAFERAAAAWPIGTTPPASVEAARQGILAALTDLEKVVPAVANVKGPIDQALNVLRQILASRMASRELPPVMPAEMPPIMAFMGFINLAATLLASGRTTYERLRELLKKEGATDEELAAADLKVSAEIARVEGEKDAG